MNIGQKIFRKTNIPLMMGGMLFFLMLYTPRANLEVKVVFLIPTLFFILLGVFTRRLKLPRPAVLQWATLYILYGFIWSFFGLLNGNPGYVGYLRLFVLWGLLYLVLITGIANKESLIFIFRVGLFALIPISIFNILLFLNSIGVIPSNFLLEIEMGAKAGQHVGYSQLTSHNIGSLLFLAPFVISIYLLDVGAYYDISPFLLLVVMSLALTASFLSGRRALWLVIFLAPFMVTLLLILLKKIKKAFQLLKKMLFVIIFLILLLFISMNLLPNLDLWDLNGFLARISDAISHEGARSIQADALLNGFSNAPIFGHGFGVGVKDVIRSEKTPWLYELSYLLILHNTGIVGLLSYLSLLTVLLYKIFKISKSNSENMAYGIPLFIGLFSFLLANSTNPYLLSFDFMFSLFLALAFMNVFASQKRFVNYD